MDVLVDDCLLKIFSYLKLRDLGRLEQVSTRFQELARRSFSVYRNININGFRGVNIRTLSHARTISAKIGPGLRRLKAYGGYGGREFTLEMLEVFLVNRPNIEHFEFTLIPVQKLGMLKLLDDFVANIGEIKIKSIEFWGCELDDSQVALFFRHLERATNLEDVSLRCNGEFTGKWLKFFKNLKKIDLLDCPRLQPPHFIEFCKRNKTLVNLNINTFMYERYSVRTFMIDQECVKTIGEELKNLQSLNICCKEDFPASVNLSILGDLPKLEELEIWGFNHLAVPMLKRLAFHNNLRTLKCGGINLSISSDERAEIYRELVKIQGLKLFKLYCYGSSEFDDEFLKMSPMDKLEELDIARTAVTNQALFDFILKNPSLRTLQIRYCSKITDEFAQMIIPRLRTDFKSLSIRTDDTKISKKYDKILLNDKK